MIAVLKPQNNPGIRGEGLGQQMVVCGGEPINACMIFYVAQVAFQLPTLPSLVFSKLSRLSPDSLMSKRGVSRHVYPDLPSSKSASTIRSVTLCSSLSTHHTAITPISSHRQRVLTQQHAHNSMQIHYYMRAQRRTCTAKRISTGCLNWSRLLLTVAGACSMMFSTKNGILDDCELLWHRSFSPYCIGACVYRCSM